MVNNERMVRDFVNAITDEVNERREEIEKSSVKYVEGQLKAAEAEILEDVFLEINRKSAEIKASVGKEVSEKASEYRQSVLSHRSTLADEVYNKAEKKITEFTKSEKYEAFLINSAKNATEFLGKESVIFVRKDDLSYAEKIEKATGCAVQADDGIVIGGIMAKRGNIIADDTLDARFEKEKEAFRENYKIEI